MTLDGSGSTDADGNPLTYLWSLTPPLGGAAELDAPAAVTPTFDVDLPGTYVGQLIVNDGTLESAPDTVSINTENSRPLACVTAAETVAVGEAVSLDGTCSSDADGDTLSFQWALLSAPDGSAADLDGTESVIATLVPDLPGTYVVQLIVRDGALSSDPVSALVMAELPPPPPNRAPQITSTAPTLATVGQPYAYAVAATDPDGDTLTYSLPVAPTDMSIDPASGLIGWTPTEADLMPTPVPVSVLVEDGRGGSASQEFAISVQQPAPQQATVPALIGLTKAAAMDQILAAKLGLGTFTYVHDPLVPDGEVMQQTPAAGLIVALGTPVDLLVSLGPEQGLPPNPVTVAPPLDATVATTLAGATEFLYTGENPIQTGVEPGTIEPRRVAVIRGKVLDRAGHPLPGVTLTILNHPEYGQTLSRADGAFDLAVNGGGYLMVNYQTTREPGISRPSAGSTCLGRTTPWSTMWF